MFTETFRDFPSCTNIQPTDHSVSNANVLALWGRRCMGDNVRDKGSRTSEFTR